MKVDNEVARDGNSYTTEFRQYDARFGKWWNVDPMTQEREWVSPYNFVQNNPINRVDPTGALDDLVITGEQSDMAMEQLQATTTLNLKRDEHTGLVTVTGNAQTEIDEKLLTIINSDITVSVEAGNSDFIPGTRFKTLGGSFLGNTITKGTTEVDIIENNKPYVSSTASIETTTVEAKQYIVPSNLAIIDTDGFKGQSILHEVTEAYIGAVKSKELNMPVGPAFRGSVNYIYEYAHDPTKNSFVVPQVGDEHLRLQSTNN
jgi:RHS repeat-associated protein